MEYSYHNARWSTGCTKTLVDAILEKVKINANCFEKPDAKTFYTDLKKEHVILEQFPWKSIRDKVRFLREKYMKAIKWRYDTERKGVEKASQEIMDEINKICPFFNEIDGILSNRIKIEDVVHAKANAKHNKTKDKELRNNICEDIDLGGESPIDELSFGYDDEFSKILNSPTTELDKTTNQNQNQDGNKNLSIKEKHLNFKKEKFELKKNIKNEHMKFRQNVERKKLELEEKKICLEVQKIEIEKEKIHLEMDIKRKQIANLFYMEKYKIDKEIELKKHELELKYQIKLDK